MFASLALKMLPLSCSAAHRLLSFPATLLLLVLPFMGGFQTVQSPDLILTLCTHCSIYIWFKLNMKYYLITRQKYFTFTLIPCTDYRRCKNSFCQ